MPYDVPIDSIPISEFRNRSFGTSKTTIRLDVSGVDLEGFDYRTKKAIKQYFEQEAAPMLRQYMVSNHKWQNRTRTAEVGLTADVVTSGNLKRDDYSIKIQLYHTAKHRGYEYGNRLERGYEGRFAILEPTVRNKGGEVVEGMRGVIEKYS